MKTKSKSAIENYQCSGCVSGSDISCFKKCKTGGIGCGNHMSGTMISSIGKVFLGLTKGFDRLGYDEKLIPHIYESFNKCDWSYCKFNIPVWKYLNENGHTLVRGLMPRLNQTFIHIYLEDCRDKIDCLEITQQDCDDMD